MGIQGLLPFLKEASEPIHIGKYKGYTVGVDTYCWIHRGAIACATQLAKGEPADHYVRYCVKYVNMLRSLDIKPVLVFDGRNLPAKASVEESRRERRETYNRKGRQFLREGKAKEARDCFVKSVNVTPEMALEVMKAVRSLGVDCIVAPYEADAQLAYLEKNGIVQAVITEDSDLIAFGCRKVIVKLDLAGNCLEVDAANLNRAMKIGEKFTAEKFRCMCIVAGCDYLASLPGIGIGKARKLFQLAANPDVMQVVKRMAITLKMKVTVSPEYLEGFQQANNTFLYQLAFDPCKKRLQPLTPYTPEVDPSSLMYAGRYVAEDKAYQMALGNLNFNTMQRMCDFDPEVRKSYDRTKTPRHMLNIWHEHFQPGPALGCIPDPAAPPERASTKGKEITVETKQRMIQRKREREDAEEPFPPTDVDLSAMYGTSIGGRTDGNRSVESQQRVILETPEKEQGHREEEGARPAKRNRFATKQVQAKRRMDILNSGEVVTSRFFQSKKTASPDRGQAVAMETKQETREEGEEEEEDKENQLNTSGLLEGITQVEEEQERQFPGGTKEEDPEDPIVKGDQDVVIVREKEEEKTHVSRSLHALQRFQRPAATASRKLQGQGERMLPSSADASNAGASSAPSQEESQESLEGPASSQGSVTSLNDDSCSQSSLSSSQRQGTPRPRSAFSWGRCQREGRRQPSLSSFAFQPPNRAPGGRGLRPIARSRGPEGVDRGGVALLMRADSGETPSSQESVSSSIPSGSCPPGSWDMAGIDDRGLDEDESNTRVALMDSQGGSSSSLDTSSVDLTSSQASSPCNSPSTHHPLPSLVPMVPPLLQPPIPPSLVPPLTQCSKDQSPICISSSSSSQDTDAVSLDSPSPSHPSSPFVSVEERAENTTSVVKAASLNHLNRNPADSVQKLEKQNVKQDRGLRKNVSVYFFGGGTCKQTGQGVEDDGSDHESENTPPSGSKPPVSPPRNSARSGQLLADRSNQVLDTSTKVDISANSTPLPKKQTASLLGRCKTLGLSKKRRTSSKATGANTPKGQTSLLAFMPRPKTKCEEAILEVSAVSSGMNGLTPESDGSLLSRQADIRSKRNIFD